MIAYATPTMESAIQSLSERHQRVIVFHAYRCQPRIFVRLNLVSAPCYLYRSWDNEGRKELGRWFKRGGVLIMYYDALSSEIPECDAMLFIECPLQMERYKIYINKVISDVVIYKPPTWAIHDNTAKLAYSGAHRRVFDTLHEIGERVPFEFAHLVERAGLPKKAVTSALGVLLKTNWMARKYIRLTPHLAPSDAALRSVYDAIVAREDSGKGLRMIPWAEELLPGTTSGPILKRLIRQGYVSKLPDVYVVGLTDWHPNFRILDAVAEARHQDWIRMREYVDQLPNYRVETRFVTPLSILCVEPVADTVGSTLAE